MAASLGQRIWGDADCAGTITLGDAIGVARHLVSLPVNQESGCPAVGSNAMVDGTSRQWEDIDCSGAVTLGDAIEIARSLVGLSVSKPIGCPNIGQLVEVG